MIPLRYIKYGNEQYYLCRIGGKSPNISDEIHFKHHLIFIEYSQ